MSYSLHPEAEQELASASAFYKEQAGLALATAFLAEFERVAEVLVQNPNLGTPVSNGLRIHPFRRFPYSVVYRSLPKGIVILVIGHQHRRPRYWQGRS
ncbi:MAG TPA: type II toxin-antitoxin system RelE/ParE family toxin [Polyangiaceae bacterium]|nr:type II toxin-antitoxin system RelE/ParE family toxin [Polyangiaceae bacterium]